MGALLTAPAAHEIEVSIFGRAYGEAIAVHLGSGQWLLVDSLTNAQGNPAALVYFSNIGVNAADCVRYIVATHWHDDHVGGLSKIYAQCPNAITSFPLALMRDEFKAFRRAVSGGGTERFGSGVRELESIATLQHELKRPPFRLGKANTVLMRAAANELAHALPVDVELLSPSDQDVQAFLAEIATTSAPEPVGRIQPFSRNDVSIVSWISVGQHRILLGADLESTGQPDRGWEAVFGSPAPLNGKASVFKISHHGSETGHHPDTWSKLLVTDATAALAPFNRNPKLPRNSDIDRIVALTSNAYGTGKAIRRAKKRDATVDKTIKDHGLSISAIADVGLVRLRLDPTKANPSWTVDLFNGAAPLSQLREAS